MAGVADTLRNAIRAAVGLPVDPGEPPDLMRLGLYRARVDKCASDGSTLDVTPEDKRISPEKNVKLCVGIAGSTSIVASGSLVHLGWEGGDPAKPYCAPIWDSGASLSKLTLDAIAMELGGNAHPLPLWDSFVTDFIAWVTTLNTLLSTLVPGTGATGGPAYATAIALPTSLIVKLAVLTNYQSTKVKNG